MIHLEHRAIQYNTIQYNTLHLERHTIHSDAAGVCPPVQHLCRRLHLLRAFKIYLEVLWLMVDGNIFRAFTTECIQSLYNISRALCNTMQYNEIHSERHTIHLDVAGVYQAVQHLGRRLHLQCIYSVYNTFRAPCNRFRPTRIAAMHRTRILKDQTQGSCTAGFDPRA